MNRKNLLLTIILCCGLLTACTSQEDTTDITTSVTAPENTAVEESTTPEAVAPEVPSQEEAPLVEVTPEEEVPQIEADTQPEVDVPFSDETTGNVYMVTFVGDTVYSVPVTNANAVGTEECEVLLRELLAGMEELTNWNLDVADIYMGKGGTTITFGEESVLIIGLTEDQVDEFFVYDQYSLLEFALGSIEKTVQMALTGAGGDPDLLDVYFSTADDQPLGFIEEGITIPIDQPYNGFVQDTNQ